MRVLLLTQHFPPEITAASLRLGPFAEALGRRGHEVEVICPVPNHPEGVVAPGYRNRPLVRRTTDGFQVRYIWVYARPVKTLRTRLAAYGSYAFGASLVAAARPRADIVLASSPPLTVGVAGALAAVRHRCPFVFDVRDLWPESAVALGELSEGPAVRAAERIERRLYARADLIITPNHAFRHAIEARGARAPVEVIANGTTAEWLAAGEAEVDRRAVAMPEDRFVWAYAGNIGLAHALDEAIDAAAILGDGFRLVVIGAGPRRAALEEKAGKLAPGTVEFRDLMTPATAAQHLRAADAVLVAERQPRTVSAKLYDCCAIGRPLIAVCTGELERVVDEHEVGLTVPLENPSALADAVRRLRDEPETGKALVSRARPYAADHLRERQADRVAGLLEDLA